jgi:putative transposase
MSKLIGNQEFDTASHCIYRLTYHVVWCSKFRRHILSAERKDFVVERLREVAAEVKCRILEANGEADHLHFLLDAPPTVCLSETIGKLKSKTASALLDKFGSFYYGKHARTVWSSGFFVASTGGVTLETLKRYVERQGGAPNPP